VKGSSTGSLILEASAQKAGAGKNCNMERIVRHIWQNISDYLLNIMADAESSLPEELSY
jgi:hypothetical protein